MHPKIPHSNNSHSNLPHSLYHYNLRKLSYSYFPSCYLIRRTSQTQKDYCYHQKSKYVAYLLTCHQTNHYFIIGLILTFTIFPTNQQFQCMYVVRSLRGKKILQCFSKTRNLVQSLLLPKGGQWVNLDMNIFHYTVKLGNIKELFGHPKIVP